MASGFTVSDGALILGIDPLGVLPTDTIPGPLNPCRALADDPASDHFWVAEYGEDVYEIDREGNIINQFENAAPTELLHHRPRLERERSRRFQASMIVSQNGSTLARLTRMNPFTGQRVLLGCPRGGPGDRSAGFAITSGLEQHLLVRARAQNTGGDYMQIYELAFDHSWI